MRALQICRKVLSSEVVRKRVTLFAQGGQFGPALFEYLIGVG